MFVNEIIRWQDNTLALGTTMNDPLQQLLANTLWLRDHLSVFDSHADHHTKGGSDEVGSSTPLPYAIPYADEFGTLVDWIPSASIDTSGLVELSPAGGTSAGKAVQANDPRLSDARTALFHALSHGKDGTDALSLDASQISSGVLDVARIPVLPSQKQVVSSGGLSDLTDLQLADIASGTVVTTTDGYRWVYSGTGNKRIPESYVALADMTPLWDMIEGKPEFLSLGVSSTTAYRGDHGLLAYMHSLEGGNPHGTQIADIAGLESALSSYQPASAVLSSLASLPYEANALIRAASRGGFYLDYNTYSLTSHSHTGVYQPLDADLTALAALTSTGFAKRTGTDSWSVGALVASDIPSLDWSKITTGKPTTLSGYGITDALGINATAVTATRLATPRAINGVNFDGTVAITVYDATKLPLSAGGAVDVNNFAGIGNALCIGGDVGTGLWTNKPAGDNASALLTFRTHPTNYYSQLYFNTQDNRVLARTQYNGVNTAWKNFAYTDDSMTPIAHASTHAGGASDAITSLGPITVTGDILLSGTPRKIMTSAGQLAGSWATGSDGTYHIFDISAGCAFRIYGDPVFYDSISTYKDGSSTRVVIDPNQIGNLALKIDGSPVLTAAGGYITGNQTISLSGNVTGSGTTAITTTIANGAVTFARIQNSAAAGLSVIGRSAASAGVFAEIAAGTDGYVLRRSGSTLAFGTINGSAFGSQSANSFWAGPNGSAGIPTFRGLVSADIPGTLNATTLATGRICSVSTYAMFGYNTLADSGYGLACDVNGNIRINTALGKSATVSVDSIDQILCGSSGSSLYNIVQFPDATSSGMGVAIGAGVKVWGTNSLGKYLLNLNCNLSPAFGTDCGTPGTPWNAVYFTNGSIQNWAGSSGSNLYSAWYGSSVTPSDLNASILVKYDGNATYLNSAQNELSYPGTTNLRSRVRTTVNGVLLFGGDADTSVERININNTGVGFFGSTPIAKPTVTGSRGTATVNVLTSLLTALGTLGLILNSTTV